MVLASATSPHFKQKRATKTCLAARVFRIRIVQNYSACSFVFNESRGSYFVVLTLLVSRSSKNLETFGTGGSPRPLYMRA